MKLIARFWVLSSAVLALGFALFSSAQPVMAGCVAIFNIDSVTAYRDHIIINFTYNTAQSSPIQFNVDDNGTPVGSGTFSSIVPGSFTIEFDLNSSIVQELDSLKIDGVPSI